MTPEEIIEATRIHEGAGLLGTAPDWVTTRPFRAPHHTISDAGLVGDGTSSSVGPGEATIASHGVLFLDEVPEFGRGGLHSLRVALDDGFVQGGPAHAIARMPVVPQLVLAAMNPCPCGGAGRATRPCSCMPDGIARYIDRARALDRHARRGTQGREHVPRRRRRVPRDDRRSRHCR